MKNYNRRPLALKGSALLMALLIVVLASSIAVLIITERQADIRRTTELMDYTRASLEDNRLTQWAKRYLAHSFEIHNTKKTPEFTCVTLPKTTITGGWVTAELCDEQGKFNVNNFRSLHDHAMIEKIVRTLSTADRSAQTQSIAYAIEDLIRNQAEIQHDTRQLPTYPYSYSAPLFQTDRELLQLKGMTPELLEEWLPNITELPRTTAININSASATTLSLLLPSLQRGEAQQIVDYRNKTQGFTSREEMMNLPYFMGNNRLTMPITLYSDFFSLKATVYLNKTTFIFYTQFQRSIKNDKAIIKVIAFHAGKI